MVWYRALSEVSFDHLAECGGKAARLGGALRLGCRVPEGVVLCVDLYRRFMRQGGLHGEIASILATMQPTAMPHYQAAEWAIQEAFKVRRMPDEVREAIRAAWRSLGGQPAAIRSSATNEDSPQQSFVGQHATYLDVTSEEEAIQSVEGCWMSLFSAKALSYARRFGVDLLNSAMGVLLQRMVVPTAKGTLFTADPLTGNPDQFVLEVQAGPKAGIYRINPYESDESHTPIWRELRRLGLLLDEHLLSYVGIEWAVVDDEVTLLRVYPLTKIASYLPLMPGDVGAGKGPLELVRQPGCTPRAMRPYGWYHRSRGPGLRAAYASSASPLFLPYAERDEYYLNGYLYARWRRPAGDRESEGDTLQSYALALSRLAAARALDREFRALEREARPRLEALRERDLHALNARDLARHLEELMALSERFYRQVGKLGESHRVIPGILATLHHRWLGDAEPVWSLLTTTEDQLSQRDAALCRLAAGEYPSDVEKEQAFAAFWRRYRHLYLVGDPLAEAQDICTLREDVAAARRALEECRREEGSGGLERQRRALEAREEAERRVLAKLGAQRRALYRDLLHLARRYAPLRVDRDEPVLLCWLLERDVVLEAGRRLREVGLTEWEEDGRYLAFREILDWLDGTLSAERVGELLRDRRELEQRWWRYAPPYVIGDEPGKTLAKEPLHQGQAPETWHGVATSPGMAEGRARIVNTLGGANNVMPGEVLICREPLFELSPLFNIVAAVVAETGGLLDHAAILAREYGVPAVFGVPEATRVLHTGDELRVDARSGLVTRLHLRVHWDRE